jgi:phage baseplate assembly protein V
MSHIKGLVESVDGRGFVKVRLPELGITTDWLPVLQSLAHGAWDMALPRKGSQVALIPGLDLDDAVVLGCLPSLQDVPPVVDPMVRFLSFEDGTRIQYDPSAHALIIETPQQVKVSCTTFDLTGTLVLHGDLEQTGDQRIQGDTEVQGNVHTTGSVLSDGSNSAHHSHPVSGSIAELVP